MSDAELAYYSRSIAQQNAKSFLVFNLKVVTVISRSGFLKTTVEFS
jgi:hypothetical protein